MKTACFIFFVLIQIQFLFAQLNCKTMNQSDGSTWSKCFHQNGKVSTLETWDKEKRFGNLKGYNNQGKELFSHGLRTIGGHASAQLSYFPNGQVKSIYFSDAPDGGIQFYNATTTFDEVGNQTSFVETKYPYELEFQILAPDTTKPRKPIVEINQVLEKKKEKPLVLMIINKTKSRQKVLLDYLVFGKDTILELKPKQELECPLTPTKNPEFERTLDVKLSGKTNRFELIRGQEQLVGDRKVVVWYIIKG